MAGKLESEGLKARYLLWKPAVNSKLSQTGMKEHHRVKCLEKSKLIVMVIMGWLKGGFQQDLMQSKQFPSKSPNFGKFS